MVIRIHACMGTRYFCFFRVVRSAASWWLFDFFSQAIGKMSRRSSWQNISNETGFRRKPISHEKVKTARVWPRRI